MNESYPGFGQGPESGPNRFGGKESGGADGKKSGWSAGSGEAKPWRPREVGNTPVPGENRFFRPLGGEAVKSGLFERKPAAPKFETERPIANEASPDTPSLPTEHAAAQSPDRVNPERPPQPEQRSLQEFSPEQLAALAAAEAQDELRLRQVAQVEAEKSESETGTPKNKSKTERPINRAEPVSVPAPELPRAESADEILQRAMTAKFVESTSNQQLTAPDVSPAEVPIDMPAVEQERPAAIPAAGAETEAAFQAIANQPGMAELADMNGQPSDDEQFRDFVRRETGKDPGQARFHDVAPGTPPVNASGGGAGRPPFWPTARGPNFNGGPGGPGNPNQGPTPYYNGPGGWGNPNQARMPSGATIDPATWAALAGLGARQRFNSLRHTLVESALLGGEVLLAAGLIGEHFRAKRSEKKLQKQITKQGKELKQTNQALQQEHLSHQRTRERLESVALAQTATADRLQQAEKMRQTTKGAESLAGADLISAAAAAELAAKAERRPEVAPTPTISQAAERELAHRMQHSRELGQALKRNPELSELRRPDELAGVAAAEVGGGAAEAVALRQEMSHERLRGQYRDTAAGIQSGGADTSDDAAMADWQAPSLASNQPSMSQTEPAGAAQDKTHDRSKLNKPVAAATVLFVIGVILVIIFAL